MAADVSALTRALSIWEWAEYASVVAVIFGVVGESIHEFTKWFHWSHWWKDKGGKASALLLVLALAAELATMFEVNRISGRIIAILDSGTEQLRAENLLFEKQLAPRRLTPEQQKSLTAFLARYPGRSIHISSYMRDVEGSVFGGQLLQSVAAAELGADDKRMFVETFASVTTGLAITGTEEAMVRAATELFLSFGFAPVTNTPVDTFMNQDDENALFPLKIFVGAKPIPPISQARAAE